MARGLGLQLPACIRQRHIIDAKQFLLGNTTIRVLVDLHYDLMQLSDRNEQSTGLGKLFNQWLWDLGCCCSYVYRIEALFRQVIDRGSRATVTAYDFDVALVQSMGGRRGFAQIGKGHLD